MSFQRPSYAAGLAAIQQQMKFSSYIALCALSVTTATHAEGIALGNPLAGANLFGLFGLPLLGSVALLLAMALVKGLRKALLVALLLCGIFAAILALIGSAGMPNGTAVLWLIGLVLSPWICLVIIATCFIVGLRAKQPQE